MKFNEYLEVITEKNNSSWNTFYKMSKWYIPLSPKALERIFPEKKGTLYHVADLTLRENLEKLQGKRKTVSCFTDFSSDDIFSGAEGIDYDYPAVYVLNGTYTIGSYEDIYTEMDSQGRRWIMPDEIMEDDIEVLFKKVSDDLYKQFLKKDIFKEYTEEQVYMLIDDHEKIPGKLKARIIKDYLDSAEEAINKNKKEISKLLKRRTSNYNEVLGYNFKIKNIKMEEEHFFNWVVSEYKNVPLDFDPVYLDDDKKRAYEIADTLNIEIFETLEDLQKSL